MTSPLTPAGQLDLMAYADRQLDPLRRREVERDLARSPDLLEMAQAIALQNEAIREAYAGVLDEPVPDRLTAVLSRIEPPRQMARLRRIAAVAAALTLATGAGWWGGQWLGPSSPDDVAAFVEAVTGSDPAPAREPVPVSISAQPLEWLADRVTLELQAPNLEAQGYRMIDKALVEVEGQPSVRLTYQRDDGGTVRLFLRTRWRETPPTVNLDVGGGAAAAYWLDGPMMWVLTGDVGGDELGALAETIRGATRLEPSAAEGGAAQNALDLNGLGLAPVSIPQ
jgi:anti-sigma factor RsiW